MQPVFDSSKADIPSWMVRSTISHLGYYFFVFWFWYELSQRQNNLWSTVNLLGDSYEEVANLLDVPGQSAGSEHPGLWRCQEAFYKTLIFYNKIMLEWNEHENVWHFYQKENYVNYKKHRQNTYNYHHALIGKELVPHLGAADRWYMSSFVSWTQVSDPWPRIIICWESYLKSNGLHQMRIQRWGHGRDGFVGWNIAMGFGGEFKSNWYCSFHYCERQIKFVSL